MADSNKGSNDDDALSSLLLLLKQTNGAPPSETEVLPTSTTTTPASNSTTNAAKSPRTSTENVRQSDIDAALANSLSLDDLRKLFHLPIVEVAKQLGTCTTALKKVCRKYNIHKWPYRQIRSLTKSIQSLEMAGLNDSITNDLKLQYREQIVTLQKAIDDIVFDPNTNISTIATKLENEWGNGMGEDLNREPSENVKQLMQASAASVENTHSRSSQGGGGSSSSSSSKRKFSQVEGDKNVSNGEGADDSVGGVAEGGNASSSSSYPYSLLPPPKPHVEMVNIGVTQVNHVTLTGSDSKSGSIHFVGPVVLAPLERRRISKQASKKLVPLIEPDICNHFKMEFLPQASISEVKYFRNHSTASLDLQGEQVPYDASILVYNHGP